jgi:hypothetical protein
MRINEGYTSPVHQFGTWIAIHFIWVDNPMSIKWFVARDPNDFALLEKTLLVADHFFLAVTHHGAPLLSRNN